MNDKRDQTEFEQADPVFEGFVIKALDKGARAKARQAVSPVLGQGRVVRPFGDDATDFGVTRRSQKGAKPAAAARAAAIAPVGVGAVRGALLSKDTSAALKTKVSGAG